MKGKLLKEAGMAKTGAANAEWMGVAMAMIKFHRHGTFTGEQLRVRLLWEGLRPPKHPNAWGALINHATRMGLIRPTKQWFPSLVPSSHARLLRVYVRGK